MSYDDTHGRFCSCNDCRIESYEHKIDRIVEKIQSIDEQLSWVERCVEILMERIGKQTAEDAGLPRKQIDR